MDFKCGFHCKPKQTIVLLCACLFLISSFALLNCPSPLETVIIDVFNIDTYRFGILVSLCSWASLFDIVHGYILDRNSNKIVSATWIYVSLTVSGSIIYCIGGFRTSFWTLLLGRAFIGLGASPMILLINKHIIHWFGTGKYINFIYSLCESIFWLGLSFVFLITSHIMNAARQHFSEQMSFAITSLAEISVFTTTSVVPIIIIAYMYNLKKNNKDVEKKEEKDNKESQKTLGFTDYVCMSPIFWAFSLTAFLYYVSIITFLSLSVDFLQTKYNLETSVASTLSGLTTLLPSVLSPFFGLLIDRIGHNLTTLTAAIGLNLAAMSMFGWCPYYPMIPVTLMGLSLVMSSGMWSQFQFLVKDYQYMIAYGVAQTGLHSAQAFGTIIAGSIIDNYGYDGYMVFQLAIVMSSVPVIMTVWILDYRNSNFLNMTNKKKNISLGRISDDKWKAPSKDKGVDNAAFQ